MTARGRVRHDRGMDLPAPLAWLVDEAGASPGPDQFLAELGGRLAGRRPAASRRRADARGAASDHRPPHLDVAGGDRSGDRGAGLRRWSAQPSRARLAGRAWPGAGGPVGSAADSPVLGWAGTRPFDPAEAGRLRQIARFAAAPLAALAARAALAALLEAYLGRRSAARVLAGALRRGTGETIRAVLLCADLRDFTAPVRGDRARGR